MTTTKKATAKKATTKKAITKRATAVKKTSLSKRTANRRPKKQVKRVIPKKMSNFLKPVGIFIAISGALGLIALTSIGLISVFAPSVNDEPVLGATVNSSNIVIVKSKPTVAGVRDISVLATASGMEVTWRAVKGADSYQIYRSSGLLGLLGMKTKIATLLRPIVFTDGQEPYSTTKGPRTSYYDTNISKNTSYTYYIAATKKYCLQTGCSSAVGPMSSSKKVKNTRNITRTDYFKAYSNTAGSISFDGLVDKKRIGENFVYINNDRYHLVTDKDLFNRPSLPHTLQSLGKNSQGHDLFQVDGLAPDTNYSVRFSTYTASINFDANVNSVTIYETLLGSAITIRTASVQVAPDAPTGFIYHGATVNGGAAFIWTIPTKQPEGYIMRVDCVKGTMAMFLTREFAPFVLTDSGQEFNGYDIEDFGTGYGLCTARLRAFNTNNGVRLFSQETVTKFSNASKNTSAPSQPTGFSYIGTAVNNGVRFTFDVPDQPVEGYYASVACVTSSGSASSWKGYPSIDRIYSSSNDDTILNSFNLKDFGEGHGSCTASLNAYNYNYVGNESSSTIANISFTN